MRNVEPLGHDRHAAQGFLAMIDGLRHERGVSLRLALDAAFAQLVDAVDELRVTDEAQQTIEHGAFHA